MAIRHLDKSSAYNILGYPFLGKRVLSDVFEMGDCGFYWGFDSNGLPEGTPSYTVEYECIGRVISTDGVRSNPVVLTRWLRTRQGHTGHECVAPYGRLAEFFTRFESEVRSRESDLFIAEVERLTGRRKRTGG